jgi:hypothetical protein
MAEKLNRPVKMVRWKCNKEGIEFLDGRVANPGRRGSNSAWTAEMLDFLESNAQHMTKQKLADALGVSVKSVEGAMNYRAIAGRGQGAPRSEEALAAITEKAKARREARYPVEGPWVCLSCGVSKPLTAFSTAVRVTHVCLKCERISRVTKTYGITAERYEQMFADQNGVCAICKKPEDVIAFGRVRPLSVDHDHKCCAGKKSCGSCVRGLLCSHCNPLIGYLEKIDVPMESFAEYILAK